MIRMPLRNSTSDKIAIAASKCLFFACERHFDVIPLGNIAKVVSGGTPSTDNPFYWDGDIVWTTPKDLGQRHDIEISNSERYISHEGLANSSAKLLPIGTVLLSSRAPIGHLGIASVPLATNQGFKNIICSNQLNNRYLFHMLRANIDKLESLGRGNTFKEIPSRVVEELLMPLPSVDIQQKIADFLDCVYKRLDRQSVSLPMLPSPIEEQRRIVARIEELAAKIEEARGLRREANSPDHIYVSALASLINSTNTDWQQRKIADVIISIDAGWSPQCLEQPSKNNQWGILKTTSVQWGEFFPWENKALPAYLTARPELTIRKGDILITRAGPMKRVGVVVAVKNDEPNLMISDKLIRLRTDPSKVNPDYLELALSSPFSQEFLVKNKTGLADAQVNISQSILRKTPIMYPSLEEQLYVVKYLRNLKSSTEKIKKYQNEINIELNALLPSILDKAFKGEL